jgi:hypothetical protein
MVRVTNQCNVPDACAATCTDAFGPPRLPMYNGTACRAGGTDVQTNTIESRAEAVRRTLCFVIVALMGAAVLYAAWICVQNYSRIGV